MTSFLKRNTKQSEAYDKIRRTKLLNTTDTVCFSPLFAHVRRHALKGLACHSLRLARAGRGAPWLHAKLAATAVLFARAFVRCHMEKPCGIDGSVAGEPRATLAATGSQDSDASKLPAKRARFDNCAPFCTSAHRCSSACSNQRTHILLGTRRGYHRE